MQPLKQWMILTRLNNVCKKDNNSCRCRCQIKIRQTLLAHSVVCHNSQELQQIRASNPSSTTACSSSRLTTIWTLRRSLNSISGRPLLILERHPSSLKIKTHKALACNSQTHSQACSKVNPPSMSVEAFLPLLHLVSLACKALAGSVTSRVPNQDNNRTMLEETTMADLSIWLRQEIKSAKWTYSSSNNRRANRMQLSTTSLSGEHLEWLAAQAEIAYVLNKYNNFGHNLILPPSLRPKLKAPPSLT